MFQLCSQPGGLAYLPGHPSLPAPLLGKVSREPLHFLTEVVPVDLGPDRLRQTGQTLGGPVALLLQGLAAVLDVCFLKGNDK